MKNFGSSKVYFKSNVILSLFDKDGILKQQERIRNLVTVVGLDSIIDQLLDSPVVAVPRYMELGTGTPAEFKLGNYIPNSRTIIEKTRIDNVLYMRCTFPAGVGTGTVTEAGVFNTFIQDAGDMYVSASFVGIPKDASSLLVVLWTITAATV